MYKIYTTKIVKINILPKRKTFFVLLFMAIFVF